MTYPDDITFAAEIIGVSFERVGGAKVNYARLSTPNGESFAVPVRNDKTLDVLVKHLTKATVTVIFEEAS